MRLRQVEQLFHTVAQAHAEPLAPTKGDQRVRELVTLPIGIAPRVHEPDDALAPILGKHDQQCKGRQQEHDQPEEQPGIHAAQEQDTNGHQHNHGKRPHVRLPQQQPANEDHGDRHRHESLLEGVHHCCLAHGVVGGIQDGEQLHQFRRLQVGDAQRNPALRAIDTSADPRHQHQDQQQHAQQEQGQGEALPHCHRHLEHHPRRDAADGKRGCMAHQKVMRPIPGEPRPLGKGDGCRIDHHQTNQQQQGRDPQHTLVNLGKATSTADGTRSQAEAREPAPLRWQGGCLRHAMLLND